MKISYVCPRFYPHIGGVETVVKALAFQFSMRGHDISVYTTDPRLLSVQEENLDGLRVRRYPSLAPGDAYFAPHPLMFFDLRDSDCDVLHVHSVHAFPSLVAMLAKHRSRSRAVLSPHFHGEGHTDVRKLLFNCYKGCVRWIVDHSDAVHCVSYYEKRLVQSAFGETSSKITVIRNGVEKEELRKYRLSPREKYKVICAGRLEAYKNVDLVIKAMRKVCRSCPSARLVIVGDGPDQGRLQQLSRAIGLNVQFLGFVDRTQYLHELATSDLLVNVSSREAYGITVCEAAELGVQSLVGCSEALAELANEGIARSAQMPLAVDSLADDIWMCLRNPICPRTESIPAWSEVAERMAELYVS